MRLYEQEHQEERKHRPLSIKNPPSSGAAVRVGCISCNLQGLRSFNGSSSWDAYIAQFEMLAWLSC